MQRRNRIWNAVLLQVVARRHLSAKAVAAEGNRHFFRIVWGGLNQHRYAQPRQAQGICNRTLFAKIRQRDDNPVKTVRIFLKQIGAAPRFFARLNRAVLAFLRRERDYIHTRRFQRPDHLFTATFGQVVREKSPVSHDDPHCHFLG